LAPIANAAVEQAAEPEVSVIPEQPPMVLPLAVKTTVPVGEEPLTVAVKVTGCP
jgi:hypothetical protein